MTAEAFLRRAATYTGIAAVLIFLPSLISAALAAWSAATIGEIAVYSLGRTATSQQLVPWPQGWARFASPAVLLAAGFMYPRRSRGTNLRVGAFLLLALSGIAMLCFSRWFTSLTGVLVFYGIASYVVLAYFVDSVFGRTTVTAMLFATVAVLVYLYAHVVA